MVKDKIIKALKEATGEENINLDFPESEEHGDYSSNIALQSKRVKEQESKSSREVAEELRDKLLEDSSLMQLVEKIEVAGPGFINFFLKSELLEERLKEIIKESGQYGKSGSTNKRIMLEFGQPNTHKLPHIGHLYSYILGESLSRLLESVGNEVFRANYQGDIGLHVAKCLWAYKKNEPQVPDSLEERVQLLQQMYQEGSSAFEGDELAKTEIIEINKQIYTHDNDVEELWKKTRQWSVDYYKSFEERLGAKYDRYYFESEVYIKGIDIVRESLGKVFKESQGAIIFEGSKYGLHDRVFVTGQKTPTYEAKDLALETLKMQQWPFDLLIITTANEQNEYFKVVFKALQTLDSSFAGKLKHIGFGMVNLKSGKMSSRTGNILSAVELVNMTVEAVSKLSENHDQAEVVGLGAVKYSFLKNNPLQNMQFDFEESISTEGNSGPYLQYTFARTQSVLEKASDKHEFDNRCEDTLYPEEHVVMRHLVRFPEVIQMAALSYSPNLLCTYLYDVAQKFNTFYNKHKIIGSQKEGFRLKLTEATGVVLKNGLSLLGIESPQRM